MPHTLRTTGWASSSSEPFLPSSGIVYDIENQVSLGSVQEWVLDNYHMVIPMCYITYMTPDKSSMIGSVIEYSELEPAVVSWYMAPPWKNSPKGTFPAGERPSAGGIPHRYLANLKNRRQ